MSWSWHQAARLRASAALLVALAAAGRAGTARAAGPDTSHGRIDGDLSASAGLGASFGPRGPRAAVDVRLRYLWTAGFYATYEDGPLLASSAEPRRVLSTGIELRPLFLARWLQGKELGNPYLDLTLDSLGLELGAVFLQPSGGDFASRPGLQAGLGLQVPIFPGPTGPVLGFHGGARWSDGALAGYDIQGPTDRSLYLLVTLGWQQVFGAHVVDIGDRPSR